MLIINRLNMRFLYIQLLIFIILFSHCHTGENNNGIPHVLSFDVNSAYEMSGTFYDGQTKEDRIYFVKKNFHPNVRIFDEKASEKDSISLIEAEKIIGKISAVWMNSPDSIYVLSTYNQMLVIVDREGIPIFTERFNDYDTDENGNRYDLYPPFQQAVQTGDNIEVVFTTFWRENLNNQNEPEMERTLEFVNDNIRNGCLMRKISLTKNDTNRCFGIRIKDFIELSEIGKSLFLPFYKTIILNNRYLLTSHYSRYVYELNNDLTVKKSMQIITDDYPISTPIILNEDNPTLENEFLLEDQDIDNCYIANMLYDKDKERFIVLVKNGKSSDDLFVFPFDILIYDNLLEKEVKKRYIPSLDYTPKSSFMMNGNLYIELKNKSYEIKEYECIQV